MKVFENSQWIWWNKQAKNDEFAEFYDAFFVENIESVICHISVDSDYALYMNGKYVASNQYGDFSYYKVYDRLDITPFLQKGKNHFAVVAWHFGGASQRYAPAPAGLIFEIVQEGRMLNAGATRAWETLDGASAFDNAGSLCHGWSALPILYFKQLGILKEET